MKFGILIPTCGRDTLQRAIESATHDRQPGDQIIVIADGPQPDACKLAGHMHVQYAETNRTNWYGNHQMNHGLDLLGTSVDMIYQLDDDDYLTPWALEHLRQAAKDHPGHVLMPKMTVGSGKGKYTLWDQPTMAPSRVGSGNFVFPSGNPARFNGPDVPDGGHSDWQFIEEYLTNHDQKKITWLDTITYIVPSRGYGIAPTNT